MIPKRLPDRFGGVPFKKDWYIIDYDGQETIHEGRTWSYDEDI